MAAPPDVCPCCLKSGYIIEVKAKLMCGWCHRIIEGCCEGFPGSAA